MKLSTAFLVFCVALLSDSGIAFFVNSVVKPAVEPVAALAPGVDAVAGAVPSLPSSHLSILRFILASLGIPVGPLIEGSRKCITELGPDTVGAVKSLLGALTVFG
ncbi:secretoglobin family 3A member 1 [Meriones unguiculatus]|uniref:secretoglobin family 3A member 1 n=1 Tax=Meriones unguiculatus TaxID=10047 RepID=UPI000B4E8EF8|nr:secretoglobin family 3A member 1 [Meriones unguiculatus]XP_060221010.1 secretoglobin family 3A member 1 [Meriones unguiculatus]